MNALITAEGEHSPRCAVSTALTRAHGYAALATLVISGLCGLVVALKFVLPDFLTNTPSATWGLLRYDHTQGIMFGWLGNGFLAFLYFATPRLAGRDVFSARLGWALFILWNVGQVLPGWILIEANLPQRLLAIKPLEWTEFPLAINAVTELCLMLMVVQFLWPLIVGPERHRLYISAWYILGGAVFSALAFPMGSLVPEFTPGAVGAAFSGLWIHDAVGLLVTPFILAMAYYVIPATTGKPIYSHFISMLGFWILFFVYPLNGTHHYVYSAIPMDTQKAAIAASLLLGCDVIMVVYNLLRSLDGSWKLARQNVALRFIWVGVVFYLVVSVQGALQALMPVQRTIHFTDWVIGHSHLAMLGFASFIATGTLLHIWQNLTGLRYHPRHANRAFWLIFGGLMLMVVDLSVIGIIQGRMWATTQPWMDSVRMSMPWWWIRAISGLPILLGFGFLIAAMAGKPTEDNAREAR
ncbi:cbb3-type cytochrome c oxidase subunit I [Erwinia sp. B116]|uniref:cbb3-type cytochrome c oxidase subunit I n=1 Tax=Erwinia sp. B116 TaxID=1561024 RepID=UPI000C761B24|nr:cbb3-type cytochrome c oxidase subunit I [Erwinia sp. B116]